MKIRSCVCIQGDDTSRESPQPSEISMIRAHLGFPIASPYRQSVPQLHTTLLLTLVCYDRHPQDDVSQVVLIAHAWLGKTARL